MHVEEETFPERVTLRIAVPAEAFDEVSASLRELTNGEVRLPERVAGQRYYAEA